MRLTPQEHFDFQASKEALSTLARTCRKRGVDRALLDLRGVPVPAKPLFTPNELASLVNTFHEEGFGRRQRLAVLLPVDPHGGGKMFAFISRMRGWQVQAFVGFEEARLWLSTQNSGRTDRVGEEIPIRFHKKSI